MTNSEGTSEGLANRATTQVGAGICRRDLPQQGAWAAFLAALITTFFASQALAGSQLSVPWAPLCVGTGGLCVKDSNGCSDACTAGIGN